MKDCSICNELHSESVNNRLFLHNNIVKAYLYKDEHFTIIPSIGALKLGHSLIVTNQHTNSIFRYLKNEKIDIENLLKFFWEKAVPEKNKILLCFEHGSNQEDKYIDLCSTCHAHLHIIPIEKKHVDKIFIKLATNISGGYIHNNFESILKNIEFFNDYLVAFIFDGTTLTKNWIQDSKNLPSQYMRKIIGDQIQNKNWNWKNNIDNSLTIETIKSLDFQLL